LVVMSGSMEPAIPTGSLLLVRRIPAAEMAVGEVVSFRHPDDPGRLLTHRVQSVSVEGDRVMVETRGDANTGAEKWAVSGSGTVGRAVWHLPLLGYLVVPIQGVAARILLLVAPALALAVLLLIDIWRPGVGRPGRRPAPLPAGGGAS
ncbi:MAG: signal peptidase I, partial [Acidimicrobiia bacterium]|nr:signal peptidase I [Acidimicrobiia bacterium]